MRKGANTRPIRSISNFEPLGSLLLPLLRAQANADSYSSGSNPSIGQVSSAFDRIHILSRQDDSDAHIFPFGNLRALGQRSHRKIDKKRNDETNPKSESLNVWSRGLYLEFVLSHSFVIICI